MSLRFGVAVSRFNREITEKLLESCLKALRRNGIKDSAIRVVRVPGAFELPWAAQELAVSGRFDAVICLGAVLKGQTPQNDHISRATIFHLQELSLSTRIPCILGVITPNTHAQAMARTKGGLNRGTEAALAAIEMARLKAGRSRRGR